MQPQWILPPPSPNGCWSLIDGEASWTPNICSDCLNELCHLKFLNDFTLKVLVFSPLGLNCRWIIILPTNKPCVYGVCAMTLTAEWPFCAAQTCIKLKLLGEGVAQLVERWTRDPKTRGSNAVRSTRKNCEFFWVKNVVLTHCRCAQLPCVYTRLRMITLKIL